MRKSKIRIWHVEFDNNPGPLQGDVIAPPGSTVEGGETVFLGPVSDDPDDKGPFFPDGTSAQGWWFNVNDVDEDGNVVLNPPGPKQ